MRRVHTIKRHVMLVVASIFACLPLLTLPVSAEQTILNVSITNTNDMCNNVFGVQLTIPAGMQRDAGGNCFTPVQPPFDACLNLVGLQSAIPNGYYRDTAGNCQPIPPAEPVDVCSNLDGVQTAVPEGMVSTPNGSCIPPEVDQCNNIDGMQAIIPAGMMVRGDKECYTPPLTAPPTPGNTQPRASGTNSNSDAANRLENVMPGFLASALAPAIAPILNAIPEDIKEALRATPPEVARSFPYYLFGGIFIAAGVLLWQAIMEARALRALFVILGRQRSIAEQKDNFIMLASHYMHTPLTLMRDGVTTVISLGEIPESNLATLRGHIDNLQVKIDDILARVTNNADVEEIAPPPPEKPFWKSWSFILPILFSIALTMIANFLFGVVGNIELGALNLMAQIIMAICAIVVLYTAIRNHRVKKRNRMIQEQLVTHEEAIDNARNKFITEATTTLKEGLGNINASKSVIDPAPHRTFFYDGYQRFVSILNKFTMLGMVQSGVNIPKETFNVKQAVQTIIEQYDEKLKARNITIVNDAPDKMLTAQKMPFYFVIQSLIDNAVKYSKDGGVVNIHPSSSGDKLEMSVVDQGAGVPEKKIDQLFKPFSRAENVTTFDYEGLGFSLFLDKIIMESGGGEIRIDPNAGEGTTVTIATPLGDPTPEVLKK